MMTILHSTDLNNTQIVCFYNYFGSETYRLIVTPPIDVIHLYFGYCTCDWVFCCMVHISLKITGPSNLSTIYKTVKHDAYQHELSDY